MNIGKSDEDEPMIERYGELVEKTSTQEEIQSPSVRTEQIFEKMDLNKDGVITGWSYFFFIFF